MELPARKKQLYRSVYMMVLWTVYLTSEQSLSRWIAVKCMAFSFTSYIASLFFFTKHGKFPFHTWQVTQKCMTILVILSWQLGHSLLFLPSGRSPDKLIHYEITTIGSERIYFKAKYMTSCEACNQSSLVLFDDIWNIVLAVTLKIS